MQIIRRLHACVFRDAWPRLSGQRLFALFLLIVVPGSLVVPICYGIYGAIRLTLAGKAASRADVPLAAALSEVRER